MGLIRTIIGYLRPERQILLVPHRDGMLVFEGCPRQRLTPELSKIIEALARRPGEVVTHEELAAILWPGMWPDTWYAIICRRIAEARLVLPKQFILTVRKEGYCLAREIKIEGFQPVVGPTGFEPVSSH